MKHSHLVAGLAGMVTNVHLREGEEVFVSYLPLAHILALQIETILLTVGSTLCYADPRQLPKAMPKFQPTLFAGVPKVWELLQGGLTKKIAAGPPAIKIVFNVLLNWKITMLQQGLVQVERYQHNLMEHMNWNTPEELAVTMNQRYRYSLKKEIWCCALVPWCRGSRRVSVNCTAALL